MDSFDIFVYLFLFLAVVGLSYRNAAEESLAHLLSEGFQDTDSSAATVYMFYSLTSVIPGKKCRQNYKLFKENRHYMQLWNKFRHYLQNTGRADVVDTQAINVDENPEYVAEFDITRTPIIVISGGPRGDELFRVPKGHLPTLNQLITFYEARQGRGTKDLQNYSEAVVYLYLPNCYDCRKYYPEWQSFKDELKSVYPDISVFEVNVANNPQYDKYIYRFQGSVYPLILTKSNDNVTVSDITELYGSFSYDNLFRLVDETFFQTQPSNSDPIPAPPQQTSTADADYDTSLNKEVDDVVSMNQIFNETGSAADTSMNDGSNAITVDQATLGLQEILAERTAGIGRPRRVNTRPEGRPSGQLKPQRDTLRRQRPVYETETIYEQSETEIPVNDFDETYDSVVSNNVVPDQSPFVEADQTPNANQNLRMLPQGAQNYLQGRFAQNQAMRTGRRAGVGPDRVSRTAA